MECLHGAPTAVITTRHSGDFHVCANKKESSCNFFCSPSDVHIFDGAVAKWRLSGVSQPSCPTHQKPARLMVVKDIEKANYGRHFFVCSYREDPCSFWTWGDEPDEVRPLCKHGVHCAIRKVKKSGRNKGRLFFCCPNEVEACYYFEWKTSAVPDS